MHHSASFPLCNQHVITTLVFSVGRCNISKATDFGDRFTTCETELAP
jgi:hypothetical protein